MPSIRVIILLSLSIILTISALQLGMSLDLAKSFSVGVFRSWEQVISKSLQEQDGYSSYPVSISEPSLSDFRTFEFKAYGGGRLAYARSFILQTQSTSVFKHMIIPSTRYDHPIFGLDVAILADGGSVFVLDYYALPNSISTQVSTHHSIFPYIEAVHKKWVQGFPLPEKAVLPKSFSSAALFTRLTDANIQEVSSLLHDYITLYTQHLSSISDDKDDGSIGKRKEGLAKFLKMRIQTDSIKKVLLPKDTTDQSASRWADRFMQEYLYPLQYA